MKSSRLFEAEFYSGCIDRPWKPWTKDKEDWVRSKFGKGLCEDPCFYFQVSEVEVVMVEPPCPEGQVSIKLTIWGYCVCPEGD